MNKHAGFTILELMVVIAIIGILSATAMPLYRTMQQRTYGREAVLMAKQILDAQIIYFLEHDKFYPETDILISINNTDPPDKQEIIDILDNLKITIPVNHFLDYAFYATNTLGGEKFTVLISAHFPLFRNDSTTTLTGTVYRSGKTEITVPDLD